MALAPLAVIGGFWSWGIARIAKSAYRWILAPLTTVMMVLLTQWSFFSFFEGIGKSHLFVLAYNADHLWIILPFIVFITCLGVSHHRHAYRDGYLFRRYGYAILLLNIGVGMWNLRPPEFQPVDLDTIDPAAIECCDAVYGQFVEANKLKELSTLTTIILTQQICEEFWYCHHL